MVNMGRLEPVNLREAWMNEARDFTPWLAQELNLKLLMDTIGLEDFEFDSIERKIGAGAYRADIVCRDTVSDSLILIENQLEPTDHLHLGQILTYAAGLKAVTVVWVAAKFTDDHRAALDWLNDVTDENINFFGLEIELWRIADSPIAPKFNIVSQPNDWTRAIAASRQAVDSEITPVKQMQLEYWTGFAGYLKQHNSTIRTRKPRPQHWMNFSIGRSRFRLSAFMNTQAKRLGIQLAMTGPLAKPHFFLLQEDKDAINAELQEPVQWRELPAKAQSDITLRNEQFDPNRRDQWEDQFEWLRAKLEKFHRVFAHRVKALDAGDYVSEDDEVLADDEV